MTMRTLKQTARTSSENTPRNARNAKGLFIAALPLMLVLGSAATGFARQQLQLRRVASVLPPTAITQTEVSQIAQDVCKEITGGSVAVNEPVLHQTSSLRRQQTVLEWGVGCKSGTTAYELRLNAKNGDLYAVNRMEEKTSVSNPPALTSVSQRQGLQAEKLARRYLRLLNVTAVIPVTIASGTAAHYTVSTTGQWNFTYRHPVPGEGMRLVKVSISRDGTLRSMWNPSKIL